MAAGSMDRKTEALIGTIFLAGMVITLILAIATFEGTPTILLVVTSLVFLGVAIFFFSGSTSSSSTGASSGSSQQQSVVLGNGTGPRIEQSSGASRVYVVCRECDTRVPETSQFCPECGAAVEA